ncbi:hypothetical protein [Sphingobium sp. B2]|uniref:hypothetical protein n=1 Tax=Sphingobium sp. B2 TaxID=2583228 RepID=UPI0021BDAAA3|nr:hypothetical protein [Sphingobium sp. B2]
MMPVLAKERSGPLSIVILGVDSVSYTPLDVYKRQRLKQLVGELRAEWHELDTKVEALNGEFVELARKMCIRDSA